MLESSPEVAVRQRNFLSYVLLLCACATSLRGQQYPPLAEVLQQESIPFPPISIPHLNALITSYATLNDSREFLIAYYLADPKTEILRGPLFITRYSKLTGQWQHVALDSQRVEELSKSSFWIGSVLKASHKGNRYYLALHLGPDAGCLLILKDDLSLEDALLGWAQGWFKSGAVLYTKNMIHFADVHPETLWLYDPDTRESKQLYPQPHDPFSDAFSTRLERVINNDRCRVRNWGCDPQRFTSDLASLEINDDAHSLAAQIRFEPEGFLDIEEAQNSGKWDDDDYVYVYQLQPFRWREFSIYDLKPKFGTDSLKELLTPEKIDKVFATPAPD